MLLAVVVENYRPYLLAAIPQISEVPEVPAYGDIGPTSGYLEDQTALKL